MGRWLRRLGIALLCSLLAGFAFGTCWRLRAERPTVYIGALDSPAFRRTDPAHSGVLWAGSSQADRDSAERAASRRRAE
jgi:hypothetical protein